MPYDVTKAIDAFMVAAFPGFLSAKVATITVPSNTHTLTVAALSSHSHTCFPGIAGTVVPVQPAPTAADIAAGLRAMIAAIEADRKARPVHAAITATHRAFRSDGRPHHYQDPLLDD